MSDELIALSGLMPLLEATLRSAALCKVYATDASSSRAGACEAPVSEELWQKMHEQSEEKGCYIRLVRGGEPLADSLADNRLALGAMAAHLNWKVLFGYRFKHMLIGSLPSSRCRLV